VLRFSNVVLCLVAAITIHEAHKS